MKLIKNTSFFFFRKDRIYNELVSCINILYTIALKNNELDLLALKKDKMRYGYSQQILMENFSKKKEKSDVYDFFKNSLMDIEKICSNKIEKERIVSNFMRKHFYY